MARIRAAVRRSSLSRVDPDAVIRIGDIQLDPARRLVRKRGELIHVTPAGFDLSHYLMSYGGELEYPRTFVPQLWKKLEGEPPEPASLLTESFISS